MRHNKKQIKLGRTSAHRRAMFRNMLSSLFENGSIITTDAKARELKRRADKLIGFAKKGTLSARREAARHLYGASALQVLFNQWGPSFDDRTSGFTRLVKIGPRKGDAAPMTLIELIGAMPEDSGSSASSKEA
ncbi:MAG: 50S ribosomal protein L17 [Deltaproteobacteria bacterium]|nr:50S ribosomal protein L17 [Deltaproteobacteria bacterium]